MKESFRSGDRKPVTDASFRSDAKRSLESLESLKVFVQGEIDAK